MNVNSNKKRKRPFNWDDVYQSSSEDERKIIKKRLLEANFNVNATFQSSSEDDDELNSRHCEDAGCVLCGHLKYGGCDITDAVETSQHTFSDVLQKLLGRSETESNNSDLASKFQQGKLCTICKVRLQNLYRLQKELREEKSGIINVFKESDKVRKDRKIEKNVEQILSEMRNARKLGDKSKKKKSLFKNKSDSLLDYNTEQPDKDKISKKTPEQNKSNLKRFEIHSIKKRKGERFLIKWDGYSDEENTWEQRASIPQYILKYYEDDPDRFGLPAPKMPNKFRTEEMENSSDEEIKKDKNSEKFDINSIIDGLYKEDSSSNQNLKITLKKRTSSNFYIEPEDQLSLKRVPTKAALKQSQEDKTSGGSEGKEDMSSMLREEEEIENFNISFESKAATPTNEISHDSTGPNDDSEEEKTDEDIIVDDSPPPPAAAVSRQDKDSKKTKVLGKIFVSTPERKRSADVQSEEMIKAVLREEDIYTIEALVDKKGSKYLVKWENFPHDQNTWEPKSAIPPFIIKYYEQNLSRLGRPVPAPPSPESEYIPAVDSIAEDSDNLYEQDDDWKPSDKKKRRKSGAITKKSKPGLENITHPHKHHENVNKLSRKLSR